MLLFFGLYWRRATREGALGSMIAVSLMTPAPSEKLLDDTMTGLYIRREEIAAGRPQGRAAKDAIKASNKLSDKI